MKYQYLGQTTFVNGLPITKWYRELPLPVIEVAYDEIYKGAKPCDCCCDDSSGTDSGGGAAIANLPTYASREAAQADTTLVAPNLWKASNDNVMGAVPNTVYQKT